MSFENLTKDLVEARQNQMLVSKKKLEKWSQTGLLEGLKNTRSKINMARLLENEAVGLLREASDTSDIKGFQAVAFPMVRRVFGHLLTQEIASVQPMALPSGLLFWLDFTYGSDKAGIGNKNWTQGGSIYGDPLSPLTGGAAGAGGHYYLQSGYTQLERSGAVGVRASGSATWANVDYDPELSAAVALSQLFFVDLDYSENAGITNVDTTNYKVFAISGTFNTTLVNSFYRRHNTLTGTTLRVFYSGSQRLNSGSAAQFAYVKKDVLGADTSGTTLNPAFEYAFDSSDVIPQIDIKIASMPVTANSRKLKVLWTPEVAQDLNAYHSVDAESELTTIMSDHVALDIDSEILTDIVNNARAAKFYWSRIAGNFVDKNTGAPTGVGSFTGNQQEWYLTLMETILDVSNVIHRKILKSGANFLVTSPDVCTILESMQAWRPILDLGDPSETKYSMGAEKVGSLGSRFQVYKVPFFYRNVILVGFKGNEWLETGYVYAPYVPLIVTPTIYEPDNFTPRKGVMTRYAKQIVRGDFYGLVIVKDMGVF